jgi:hypothetical protein
MSLSPEFSRINYESGVWKMCVELSHGIDDSLCPGTANPNFLTAPAMGT